MSRMSDMAQTIEELRSAATAISDAADWLTKVFSSEPQAEDASAGNEAELTGEIKSVLSGRVIPIEEVDDNVFSQKIMGDGVAIEPEDTVVKAPADATVTVVMKESGHACGLTLANGLELLIHVGINTVELNGQHYTAYVSAGDTVKKGQLMLEFDIPAIQKAGYDITTPVIVSNSDDFEHVEPVKTGTVHAGEEVLQIW